MAITLRLALEILALVCFALAVLGISPPRTSSASLVALGLFCWLASTIVR